MWENIDETIRNLLGFLVFGWNESAVAYFMTLFFAGGYHFFIQDPVITVECSQLFDTFVEDFVEFYELNSSFLDAVVGGKAVFFRY